LPTENPRNWKVKAKLSEISHANSDPGWDYCVNNAEIFRFINSPGKLGISDSTLHQQITSG